MSTADHVFFSAQCFSQFAPCSHTHKQYFSSTAEFTALSYTVAASLLKTYTSSKGVTTKYFSQLKSQRLTRGVMKHLISAVEIQKEWVGVLTQ